MQFPKAPIVLAVLFSLTACAGSEPMVRAQGYASGTRLQARVFDGGNGAQSFIGWQDTQINEPCTYVRTSSDTWRCLPGAVTGLAWLDAACTQSAVFEVS